jgi:hypothetical protein
MKSPCYYSNLFYLLSLQLRELTLPGFTTQKSLYVSEAAYRTMTVFGIREGIVTPHAFHCTSDSCFDCRHREANSYEDPYTELGPPSDGWWKDVAIVGETHGNGDAVTHLVPLILLYGCATSQ